MSNIPDGLKYSKEHEWVKADGDTVTLGITDHAQSQLGDVVFLELPEVGRTLAKDEAFGVVESVKAVSDLYAPIAGEVVEVNSELVDAPEKVNESPYDDAWMVKMKAADAGEVDALLDAAAYKDHCDSEG